MLFLIFLQAATCGTVCDFRNPFFAKLVQNGKVTMNLIAKRVDKCGKEWSTYGSCCTLESATSYAEKDNMLMRRATQVVSSSMVNQKLMLDQMMPDLKLWIMSDKRLKKMHHFKSSSEGNSKFKIDLLTMLRNKMKDIGTIDESVHQKCWIEELGKMRSSSLCSTCSARSNQYFMENKALISFETCSKMLDTCYPSISQIIKEIGRASCRERVLMPV